MSKAKTLLKGMGINPLEKIDNNAGSYWTLYELIDHCADQFSIPVVIVPTGTLCKCGNEFLIYNDREGLNVCTLCGKSELA